MVAGTVGLCGVDAERFRSDRLARNEIGAYAVPEHPAFGLAIGLLLSGLMIGIGSICKPVPTPQVSSDTGWRCHLLLCVSLADCAAIFVAMNIWQYGQSMRGNAERKSAPVWGANVLSGYSMVPTMASFSSRAPFSIGVRRTLSSEIATRMQTCFCWSFSMQRSFPTEL